MEPVAIALIGLVPILTVLSLMLGLGWSAARAGGVGLGAALLLTFTIFRARAELPPWLTSSGSALEAAFTAAAILWIIFPALCIHHLQIRTGGTDALRSALTRISASPAVIVFLVAWFFALFIEGAAGFGTTIALAAPFLVASGYRPITALAMALIGHAAGVSFGAVGTPILPQIAATGAEPGALAEANARLHLFLAPVLLLFLLREAGREGPPLGRARFAWAALAAVTFLLPYYAIARFVGPELPSLGGALVGGLVFAGVARLASVPANEDGRRFHVREVLRAATPYGFLVLLVLATRLTPPLRTALEGLSWSWTIAGTFEGRVAPLYHPGTLLMISFLGASIAGGKLDAARAAASGAARQLARVAVALFLMLWLSRTMLHSGMIDAAAELAAASVGRAWPVVAPFVGVLGTFVTGSATASNILFSELQDATATNLQLPVLVIIAAQGFGAAVGNIICPHNLVAGAATVEASGQEGAVLRRTILPCLIYALLGGLLALLLAL